MEIVISGQLIHINNRAQRQENHYTCRLLVEIQSVLSESWKYSVENLESSNKFEFGSTLPESASSKRYVTIQARDVTNRESHSHPQVTILSSNFNLLCLRLLDHPGFDLTTSSRPIIDNTFPPKPQLISISHQAV